MARDVTVTFGDGSSHIYQNAPDDITPSDIQARAEKEFGKSVTALDGGRKAAAPVQNAEPPKDAGFSFGDIAKSFGMGATGSTKALTDVAGAGNVASEALDRTTKDLQKSMTPERRAELARQEARMKAAEKSGSFLQEIKAGALNVAEAPIQSTAQALGSFVPYLPALFASPAAIALGLTGRSLSVVTAIAKQAPKVIGTAQGAGAVKGSIYEGVLKAETEAGVKPELAKQKADAAQAYFGKNFDQIALGLGLGYVAGSTGVEKFIPKSGRAAAPKNLGRRVAGAALSESLPEGAQGGQERAAQNIALQREGFDVDTFKGVAGAAAQEALMGALGSAPIAALSGPEKTSTPPPPETEDTTGTQAPPPPPTTEAPPAAPAASQDREQKVAQRTQELERTGIAPDDAIRLAEDDVAAEEQRIKDLSALNTTNVRDAVAGKAVPTPTQVKTRAVELIDAGVDPATAYATAMQQIQAELENDALNAEQGALDVTGPTGKKTRKRAAKPAAPGAGAVTEGSTALGEPIGGADRAGVSVAEQPETAPPAEGIEESQPDTVVSTGPATDGTAVGAGQQPDTLAPTDNRQKRKELSEEITKLEEEQRSLMSVNGRIPNAKSPKRARWEALDKEIPNKTNELFRLKLADEEQTQQGRQPNALKTEEELLAEADEIDRQQAEKDAKREEVRRIAKANFNSALDQASDPEYGGDIDAAFDSYKQNTYDTLNEEGFKEDPEFDYLLDTADREFTRLVAEHKAKQGTTTDGTKAPETIKTKTKRQKAPATTNVTGIDIDAASEVTDPAEIEQLMLKVDAEFNSLRSKDGRMPKERSPKGVRAEALSALYRALKAKSAPAKTTTETSTEAPVIDREALDPESREEVELLDDLLNNYNNNPDENSARNSAQQIYRTANDSDKPRAARAYAQQLLDSEVDPKDYSTGAQGNRMLPASKVGQSKVDTKFTGFTNGVQAASHIMKTGNVFQKFLAKRLRGALGGIKFVVLEKGDPTPAALQKEEAAKWSTAFGAYVPGDRTVYVRGASFGDMQGVNNIVVLHELLHAATSQKIRLGKIAIRQGVSKTNDVVASTMDLIMIMGNAQQRFNELKAAGKLPAYIASLEKSGVFTDVDEFLAYGMSDETFQKFLMNTKGFGEDSSAFTKFVHTIAKFFGMAVQQENALMDLIVASDRLLSAKGSRNMQLQAKLENQGKVLQSSKIEEDEEPAKIEAGARSQKDLDKAVAKANFKFETSKKAAEAAKGVSAIQMMQDPSKAIPALKALWKRVNSAKRNALVKVLPTQVLVDWVGNDVPELQNTYTLMQKMAGMTNQLLRGSSELSNDVERAYRADPELPAKLNKITSIATLAEIDPATIDTADRSPALDKLWKDLGPEGQRVYKQIRNHFGDLSKYLSKLLDDQVNNSKLSALDKANLMKKIRSVFERGGKISPYFALVRNGDFWLSMGDGETRTFFMAETEAERDNVAREFAAEQLKRKDGEKDSAWEKRIDDKLDELIKDEKFAQGNDIRSLREKPYSSGANNMLSEVFGAIDKTDLGSPGANDSLKDAIYQAFLETMPDQSFRKQFIHRKGVAGFRPDVLRNTAHASARMATQLARIKYSPLLRTSLSAAEDSIKGRIEFEPFVNDMKERVDASIAPKAQSTASRIVGGLNKASFIYYLSGASSALLQPLSVFQTGLPVLARYGAFNATKEMGKMFKVWNQLGMHKTNNDGTKSWVAPSVEHSNLSPEERRAYNAAAAMDLFTATQAGSVFEYKATPSDELKSPKVKLANSALDALVFGGLMNASERISREMMFMASFNLNMKEHKNFSRAVEQAVLDTNAALGNYGEYARPAFMNGLSGKLLTQFMMYPLHITTFLIKNFREMIKPMDKRTRGEAAQRFFGTLGTTFVLAGASGLPMFSTVMGLLGAAWDEIRDDLPEDLKSMDFELWFRTKFLDEQLGGITIFGKKLSDIVDRGFINAATGLDVAGRTGANNMWFRDSKETATLRESATAMALEKMGPSANMILSYADGADAAMQGDYAKAVKKWAPAGFRNFVTAHELASKGAQDNKGAQILSKDAFSAGQLMGQSIGFRSDLLANTQYATFKVLGLEQKIKNERNQILNNLDREYRKGNGDAYVKALEKREEFNKKYPAAEITVDNLIDSMEKRAKQRGESWRGFTLTEKNVGLASQALAPSRRAATEAERKGRGE